MKNSNGFCFALFLGMVACAVMSSAFLWNYEREYREGRKEYEILCRRIPEISEKDETPDRASSPGFDPESELRQINLDYVGWVRIPGTRIDYPVVKSRGYEYYLSHTFEGKKNSCGCIFTGTDAMPPFHRDRTILYGHNMKDGSMFSGLKKFLKESFREKHSEIWVLFDGRWHEYRISRCRVEAEDQACDSQGTGGKQIILSTCYGKGRRLTVEAEFTEKSVEFQ